MKLRPARDDESVARRLCAFGGARVGGATAWGRDDAGLWIERELAGQTLSAWMRAGPVDWRQAIELVASVADALAACEHAALFPGPVTGKTVRVRADGTAELAADSLIGALAGTGVVREEVPARWMSPELAAGGEPDSASNRYALGLILYRLLCGEHPFGGRGLRLGLDDQAQRGAPPFGDDVAKQLPPGLQASCLALLAPVAAKRPGTAREIVRELRGYLATSRVAAATPASTSTRTRTSTRTSTGTGTGTGTGTSTSTGTGTGTGAGTGTGTGTGTRRRRIRPALSIGLLAAGVAVAGVAIASVDSAEPAPRVVVPAARPLAQARNLDDCAGCHPRQASEWRRSVMAHSVESPLFGALEILIQEQVGRDRDCPGGAGILREADPATACRDRQSGLAVTGSGGELWCVNCHAPGENLAAAMPRWNGVGGDPATRRPLRDLLPASTMEGISCAFCHQVDGPVHPGDGRAGGYEGNPSWISTATGQVLSMRPEDRDGLFGIANSGYSLAPETLLGSRGPRVRGGAHAAMSAETRRYLRSSEFCGSCHDVRLFGTDVLGAKAGESFKRLRNAYTEWAAWGQRELAAGRRPASCQDCHMSEYPGVCSASPGARGDRGCPPGTAFTPRPPGSYPRSRVADGSLAPVTTHTFSGVDVPLAAAFDERGIDDPTLDVHGIPLGARQRRDMLLASSMSLAIAGGRRSGGRLELPLVVTNIGAGHKIPAGFSQEREFWIHLRVTDARGDVVYEVGRIDRNDQDLRDKLFLRITTDPDRVDRLGRPEGLFGADVIDGPDHPQWSPDPSLGGSEFRGRGLVNFQNGFLRCVRCIGVVGPDGRCQPGPGQGSSRADRYADGDYDQDTGECRSNLSGRNALFETYFPIGALDASRGIAKGPDAIIDTRSLAPGEPVTYVYELPVDGRSGPFRVEARLLFRAFPPYLIAAFADYEAAQAARGLRPSGPLITRAALDRIEVVELLLETAEVP